MLTHGFLPRTSELDASISSANGASAETRLNGTMGLSSGSYRDYARPMRATERQMVGLPAEILTIGSLRGDEYAWRAEDIPAVIAAAREVGLINVGGQLQFRGPEFTCECYWVEVDTYKAVSSDLPFKVRVDRTAEAATGAFETLSREVDFLAEGRNAFPNVLGSYDDEALRNLMWFAWYVSSK